MASLANALVFSCINPKSCICPVFCCSFLIEWTLQGGHGQTICLNIEYRQAMRRKGGFNNMFQRGRQFLWLLNIGGDFFPIVLSLHYSPQIKKPRTVRKETEWCNSKREQQTCSPGQERHLGTNVCRVHL